MNSAYRDYRYLIAFTLIYLAVACILYLLDENWEFLTYLIATVLGGYLLLNTLDATNLERGTLWGLSIMGMIHMLFGVLTIDGDLLYELRLLEVIDRGSDFYVLKMDQVVHFTGYVIVAMALYQVIAFRSRSSTHRALIAFLAWAGAMGIGAANEVVEYAASISFSDTHVGTRHNTGLDLIFNLLGGALGVYLQSSRTRSRANAAERPVQAGSGGAAE